MRFLCPGCRGRLVSADGDDRTTGRDFFLCPGCDVTWIGDYDSGTLDEYVGQEVDLGRDPTFRRGPSSTLLGLRFRLGEDDETPQPPPPSLVDLSIHGFFLGLNRLAVAARASSLDLRVETVDPLTERLVSEPGVAITVGYSAPDQGKVNFLEGPRLESPGFQIKLGDTSKKVVQLIGEPGHFGRTKLSFGVPTGPRLHITLDGVHLVKKIELLAPSHPRKEEEFTSET